MKDKRKGKNYNDRKLLDKRPNQWTNNPKQKLFLEYYLNPESQHFGNAYRSAVSAGYAESTAREITRTTAHKWITDSNILSDYKLDHIVQSLIRIASFNNETNSKSPDDTRLKALELLAKLGGHLIERKQVAQVVKIELGKGNERIIQ